VNAWGIMMGAHVHILRVLHCVAERAAVCCKGWCTVLQEDLQTHITCSVLQCVAVFCGVLQCVAVFCSVLQEDPQTLGTYRQTLSAVYYNIQIEGNFPAVCVCARMVRMCVHARARACMCVNACVHA